MGNEQNQRVISKPLQKIDIEIVCEKITRHLQLARDRKINELAIKERELAEKLRNHKRGYEDTLIDIASLVNLMKYIKATKIIMNYSQLIKGHSMLVVEACKTNNFTSIRELSPYFEGIVWSTTKLNLSYIGEFNHLISNHFRPADVQEIMKLNKVDKELVECFDKIEPSPVEIQNYLVKFLERHKITDFKWPQGTQPTQNYGVPYYPTPYPAYNPPNQFAPPQMPYVAPQMPYVTPQMPYVAPQMPPQNVPNPQFGQPPNPNFGMMNPAHFMEGAQQNQNQAPEQDEIDRLLQSLNIDNNLATPIPPNNINISLPGVNPIPHNAFPPNVPTENRPNNPAPNNMQATKLDITNIPAPTFNNVPGYNNQQPKKIQDLVQGPEAYTDDKDDNAELGNFEPIILSARIHQMREAKV